MKEFTDEYLLQVKELIAANDEKGAKELLANLHPADIADLYHDLDTEEAEFLNKLLDDETAAEVLMELDEDDRKELLS